MREFQVGNTVQFWRPFCFKENGQTFYGEEITLGVITSYDKNSQFVTVVDRFGCSYEIHVIGINLI